MLTSRTHQGPRFANWCREQRLDAAAPRPLGAGWSHHDVPKRAALRTLAVLSFSSGLAARSGGSKTTFSVIPTGAVAHCQDMASASLGGLRIGDVGVQAAANGHAAHCLAGSTTLGSRVRFALRSPLGSGWNGRPMIEGKGAFADRGTVAATDAGRALLRELFRRSRVRADCVGCSGAGVQGMRMAKRAEALLDGFVIGDPTVAVALDMQRVQRNLRAATAYPLSLPKLRVLSAGVMQHCDPKDGATDGIVSDPSRCDFDITSLACPAGTDGANCLTTIEQVAAALIYSGPGNSAGEAVAPGLLLTGSEDCGGFCDGRIDGLKRFAGGWPWWFLGGPTSNLDVLAAPAPLLNGRALGVAVYDQYARDLGWAGASFMQTRDFFRLFLVPGMQHCEGGRALDDFDAVDALVRWVENNEVPNTLRARSRWNSAFPGRERDLCPYPEVSTYVGSSSVDSPASFRCTLPGG